MMNISVPRGTHPHWTRDYPTIAEDWPRLLEAQEAEQSGEEPWLVVPATEELRRREIAAGYAHIDRLAVDGGPLTETRPRKRRLYKGLDGLICTVGALLIATALVLAIHEVLR